MYKTTDDVMGLSEMELDDLRHDRDNHDLIGKLKELNDRYREENPQLVEDSKKYCS